MTTTDEHGCRGSHADWEKVGLAAERFARRVADDAKFFAERVEEHVTDFARNLRQEWRAAEGSWASRPFGTGSGEDMRRIFDDVGKIVRGVVDGVDDLISGLFREAEGEWTLVVLNREATCGGAGRRRQRAARRGYGRQRRGRSSGAGSAACRGTAASA